MDEDAKQLLREIRDAQKEQMELLRAAMLPPWMRWRFSLMAVLAAVTVVAVILGILVISN
jgi:hypothetical protein